MLDSRVERLLEGFKDKDVYVIVSEDVDAYLYSCCFVRDGFLRMKYEYENMYMEITRQEGDDKVEIKMHYDHKHKRTMTSVYGYRSEITKEIMYNIIFKCMNLISEKVYENAKCNKCGEGLECKEGNIINDEFYHLKCVDECR